MTIAELIELLKQFPKNSEVVIENDEGDGVDILNCVKDSDTDIVSIKVDWA